MHQKLAYLTSATLTAAVLIGGCVPFPGSSTPPPFAVAQGLQAETVVANAARPAGLAFAADGRVFYTEKNTGRIRSVAPGTTGDQAVAQVGVNFAGDRGLLGIALHPDFSENRRVYVFYSRSDTDVSSDNPVAILDHRVVYFVVDDDGAATGGEIFVTSIPAGDGTRRIGGQIAFDADGMLYIAVGDMENPSAAQDAGSAAGKVLRLDADGRVPADNPSGSAVFASGFRDPRGLAADPESGGVYVVDANSGGHDEINRIGPGSNHGWPSVAGVADTAEEQAFADATAGYRDPLFDSGGASLGPVGGGFNPSMRYGPDLEGQFFFGRGEARSIHRTAPSDDGSTLGPVRLFAENFPADITAAAFTPAGTLYVATRDALYRIAPIR